MERNNELMFKLSPLFISGNKLFLSSYEGEFFVYNLRNDELSLRQVDFAFVSDLFAVMQEVDDEQYRCSIFIRGQKREFFIEDVIEDISFIYHNSSYELFLYTDNRVLSVNLSSISSPKFNVTTVANDKVMQRGIVQIANGVQIDLYRASLSYVDTKEQYNYNAILSISEAGVLFQIETEFGSDAYLVSPKDEGIKRLDLKGENICAACYDATLSQYYFSVVKQGQQRVIILSDSGLGSVPSLEGLSGTVTPFIADNRMSLYVTGSTEGVRIVFPDRAISEKTLFKPVSKRKRIYYENALLKITSLISEVPAKLNVLFFHGGPESCEWDSPRLPGLLHELHDKNINFHIVNYAGSSGFGRNYRSVADGKTLSISLPPLIQWINDKLIGSHLILCGGSFGGSMILELMSRKEQLLASIAGSVITNPLLDLDFHISRVYEHQEDVTFFERKFSEEDRKLISVERYTNVLKKNLTDVLIILGRHDEILTIKPALKLLSALKDKDQIKIHIDDGGHSSLDYFIARESKITSFIQGVFNKLANLI